MLKKIMASVALGAAAIATVPATAAENGPKLTNDEKATLKAYQDFNACVHEGAQTAVEKAAPVVKSLLEARNKSSLKDTLSAAKASGLTQNQAQQLIEAMIEAEGNAMMGMIVEGEGLSVKVACGKKLGIGNKEGTGFTPEFSKKIIPLIEKMQKFYQQQDNAVPKPKGP